MLWGHSGVVKASPDMGMYHPYTVDAFSLRTNKIKSKFEIYIKAKKALEVISSTVPSPSIFRYCGAAISFLTGVLSAHEE